MNLSRILFFISSLRSGGAEHHLLNLVRFLMLRDVEVAVCTISPREEELDSRLLLDGARLFRIPIHSLWELVFPSRIGAISNVVSSFKPDLIHAHLFHAEVVAGVASSVAKVPVVVTRHSYGLEFNGWRRVVVKILQRRYSMLIAVNEEIAGEAASLGCPPERTIVLPNAIDTHRFKPMDEVERISRRTEFILQHYGSEPSGDTIIIGAVGGMKEVKNYPLFIRMASSLARGSFMNGAGPELRFVIIGEGPIRAELEKLISDESISHLFALTGYTDRVEDVLPLLDVLVVTSHTEGVPLSLLEAMSCGVVPVAVDVGGVGEVVRDCGIIVKGHSVDYLASAVSSLVKDPARRMELSQMARRRILDKYDTEAWGNRILELYETVLS